jgi:DNA ligase 1
MPAGDVAAACKRTQGTLAPPAPLTVAGVLATLRAMAAEKGQGSSQRRQRAALRMLRSCREAETKYLVRTLVQNLRVGANWRSVVPALARAVVIHQTQAEALTQYLSVPEGTEPRTQRGLPPPPSKTDLDAAAAAAVAAFHVCPNLDMLVSALLDGEPVQEVYRRCKLTPGIPLKPMLGKITTGIADAVSQLGGARFLAEFKYDGVRSQIHVLSDGQIKVFSRNCEDRTSSFPDVAAQIRDAMRGGEASNCVFDAEVVAVDRNGVDTMGSGGAGAGVEAMQEEETAMLAATVNAANEHRAAPAPAAEVDSVRLRPFQELAARPRGAVDIESLKVDVCVFVFDLLELNGESMLTKPLRQRRESLQRALPGLRAGYVQLAQGYELDVELAMYKAAAHAQGGGAIAADKLPTDAGSNKGGYTSPATDANAQNETEPGITSVVDRVQSTLLEALTAGAEGLMLKDLNATYEPSKRSSHWLKLKKDYCDGMVDTLDLVVIGAFYGNGRKAGWYSPFLLAAWDPETETYQSVCRCLSGFTDEFYKAATARLSATIVPKKPYILDTLESPDVWFEPREVWEIRGADLTLSPVHRAAAGMVHPERGVGLRFPRFLGIRDDKTPEDATTSVTIAGMFEAQRRGAAAATAGKEREEREDDDVADAETVDDDLDAGGVGGGLKVA